MPRGQTISFSFPPFEGWVRRIILACTGIYLFQAVMRVFAPSVVGVMQEWLALIPAEVMHGRVWQLVTYSLLHESFSHVFFNMLTLWFIGAYLERDWGPNSVARVLYISHPDLGFLFLTHIHFERYSQNVGL